jgi:hypothetical protein
VNPDNFDRFGDFKVLERQFPMEDDTMTTEREIEAEAKRWREAEGGSLWGDAMALKLSLAHARHVLAQPKPEDVEAVASIVWDANSLWAKGPSPNDESWKYPVARAIIAAYGPPPAPHELTDEAVLRCADIQLSGLRKIYDDMDVALKDMLPLTKAAHIKIARACLTAFLTPEPEPVDPRIAIVIEQLRRSGVVGAEQITKSVLAALDAAGGRADG